MSKKETPRHYDDQLCDVHWVAQELANRKKRMNRRRVIKQECDEVKERKEMERVAADRKGEKKAAAARKRKFAVERRKLAAKKSKVAAPKKKKERGKDKDGKRSTHV